MFGRKTKRLGVEIARLSELIQLAESRMEAARSAHDLSRLELETSRLNSARLNNLLQDALRQRARVLTDDEILIKRGG